jgi:hypothetical protein
MADFARLKIETAIARFIETKQVYDCTAEDDGPEWDAYEAAEHAVIFYPCRTMDDVRIKARFFLENEGPNDTLQNCPIGPARALDVFLRSLLGEAQP